MSKIPKHSISGGISLADIKFIKSYSKDKKSYEGEQVAVADNFDCEQRQAPFKTFLKVGRDDYKFSRQCKKIRKNMPKDQADDLIKDVMDINEFTEAKITS